MFCLFVFFFQKSFKDGACAVFMPEPITLATISAAALLWQPIVGVASGLLSGFKTLVDLSKSKRDPIQEQSVVFFFRLSSSVLCQVLFSLPSCRF